MRGCLRRRRRREGSGFGVQKRKTETDAGAQAMPSLTESFRMLEQAALGALEQEAAVAVAACQSHAGAQAVAVQFPAIELDPVFPGLEIVAKLASALSRPAHATRSEAEELAEERLN